MPKNLPAFFLPAVIPLNVRPPTNTVSNSLVIAVKSMSGSITIQSASPFGPAT
jgi:hypothetical protein